MKQHPNHRLHCLLNSVVRACTLPNLLFSVLDKSATVTLCTTTLILGLLQYCDHGKDQWKGWTGEAASAVYENRLTIGFILICAQGLCLVAPAFLRWLHPIDIEKADSVLDLIVEQSFKDHDRDTHTYRATVLKIRWWEFPFLGGQWAGIVCRSGETFSKSGTIFFINRQSPRDSTGFTGRCFAAEGQTIAPTSLLDVQNPVTYKEQCGLADVEYDKMKLKSAWLHVTGISRRDGRLWGFLVLDTTDGQQLPASAATWKKRTLEMETWARILGMLVK